MRVWMPTLTRKVAALYLSRLVGLVEHRQDLHAALVGVH
jgi:hypothetical protein